MRKKDKRNLNKIIISSIIVVISFLIPLNIIKTFFFVVAYLIVGYPIIKKAVTNIFHGEVFDENFLMTIATIGAFLTGEYLEGVLVMLLYQVGELFQSYAVASSRKSITELMDIRPDYANLKDGEKYKKVNPEEINIGDIILVKPGEKVPLDGVVIEGNSYLDTVALTGESVPRKVNKDDEILSGCINKTSVLTVKVTKEFSQSTASKILDLVENASNKKSKSEDFITKFARYYTPIVVISALLLAFIPPIIFKDLTFIACIKRAMTFLVISCPCALVISVPLSFFGGIGGASKNGILIKGSNYLENLSKTKVIVFDKTGTLTKGTFNVTKVNPIDITEEELLKIVATAESYSPHPIAESIKRAYNKKINPKEIKKYEELSGLGIHVKTASKDIYIGNKKLMQTLKIKVTAPDIGTTLHVAIDNKYVGNIIIEDEVKLEAATSLSKLKKENNISKLVMLTGDNKKIAEQVSKQIKLDEYYASLLPEDKVKKIEEIINSQPENAKVAFVGDGINDAPVLTRSDIGISMGALGSDAAIEASDIVIMDDDLEKLNTAITISQKTLKIVKENIYFALTIKILFLILGALGLSNMMMAVFADVGVSIIAILNAMRTLKIKIQ